MKTRFYPEMQATHIKLNRLMQKGECGSHAMQIMFMIVLQHRECVNILDDVAQNLVRYSE